VAYGTEHLEDHPTLDYFAVSLPDFLVFDEDLSRRNRVHCHYMTASGYLGLGDKATAPEMPLYRFTTRCLKHSDELFTQDNLVSPSPCPN
jgi:hypothetical protein